MNEFPQSRMLVISLAIVSLVGGLTLWAVKHADQPVLIPTQEISSNQSTGGVAASTEQSSGRSNGSRPIPASRSAVQQVAAQTSSQQPASPIDPVAKIAPRQHQITQTVKTEYPYRALISPNDPYYTNTMYPAWALHKTQVPAAWNITTGSQTVIAVIDTGFALQHEDLASQWYKNQNEMGTTTVNDTCWSGTPANKSSNSCDDDNNGYVDDWRGWNFYGRYQPTASPCNQHGLYIPNNNPMAGQSGDDIEFAEAKQCRNNDQGDPFGAVSHGTSTSGLAGAATNNNKGIATANWNVKVMPLQALGDSGNGWSSDVISAIYYAVDNGADIINMSLGGVSDDPSLKIAVEYAYAHNVLVIAAAGNCGSGNEFGCNPSIPGEMGYPALYEHVISVGSTDSNDARASFSSYGRLLDVVAPGSGSIVSPMYYRGDPNALPAVPANYTSAYTSRLYGTSFSTPIVSNIASLIKSVKPSATVDDMTALIDGSARKVSAMNGLPYTNEYGHGVIDAHSISIIAQSLSAVASPSPRLLQAGSHISEHTYSSTSKLSSGCVVSSSYCTIRLKHNGSSAERYLPYQAPSSGNQMGWTWSAEILGGGEWWASAVQGSVSQGNYQLFSK